MLFGSFKPIKTHLENQNAKKPQENRLPPAVIGSGVKPVFQLGTIDWMFFASVTPIKTILENLNAEKPQEGRFPQQWPGVG